MVIRMELGPQSYDIVLERGALQKIGDLLDLDRKVLVVTDSGVPPEYAKTVAAACKQSFLVTIPQGEGSKNMDNFTLLLSRMLEEGFTRKDCVVGVGGGVIGDLSGFAASCYMRGIDCYNVPTTLLSQVDSSIGGKTAIDFNGVKNVVGTFSQPKKVVIDPDTLKTLDQWQLHAGLAESIKMGMTSDARLFERIETSEDLMEDLPAIIEASLMVKKQVVEQDPHEKGLRRILNFGHTVGHAIESKAGGALLHGECVALGMLPMSAPSLRDRLEKVLLKYDLPTGTNLTSEQLLPWLLHDKKMGKDTLTVVKVKEIGTCLMEEVDPRTILEGDWDA